MFFPLSSLYATVQQLLQAAAAPAPATELLQRLHALGDVPILPVAGHALRKAAQLLLHQQAAAAIHAVAMT